MGGLPQQDDRESYQILPSAIILPLAPLPPSSEFPTNNEDKLKATLKNIEDQQQAVRSNIITEAHAQAMRHHLHPPSYPIRDPHLLRADDIYLISDGRRSSSSSSAQSTELSPAPTPPIIAAVKHALAAMEEHDRNTRTAKARIEEALKTERRLRSATLGWGPPVGVVSNSPGDGVDDRESRGSVASASTSTGGMGVDPSRDPRLARR